jgi:hypothetical protein
MSGNNSYRKSMNGIVSFDSGGTTIDGAVITSGEIDCTTLNATDVNATGALNTSYIFVDFMDKNIGTYITFISDVLFDYKLYASSLWPSNGTDITVNGLLNITNRLKTESIEGLGTNSTTKQLKIGQDNDNTTSINIGRAAQTILGTVYPAIPPRTTFYAVGDDDIVNKKYVDTVTGGNSILTSTNTWTGASNTFNNVINTSKIDSITPSSTYNLLTSHTGALNIGITASEISMGSSSVPVRSAYLPLITTDLCNKSYVDSVATGVGTSLLASTNTWTGTSNTFNNKVVVSNITYDTNTLSASPTTNDIELFKTTTGNITIGSSGKVNLTNNFSLSGTIMSGTDTAGQYNIMSGVTTGIVRFGHDITTGIVAFGQAMTTGTVNFVSPVSGTSSATMNIGNSNTGSVNICSSSIASGQINIGFSGIVNLCNSIRITPNTIASGGSGDTINLFNNITTGNVNIGTGLSTGTCYLGDVGNVKVGNVFTFKSENITSSGINDTINVFNNITTGTINFCNGLLPTGTLQFGAGKIKLGNQQLSGYTSINTVSANFTIPSTINIEYFIVITGNNPRTITLPASPAGAQIINIRNRSVTTTHSITTFPSTTIGIYPNISGSARFQPAWSMPASSAQRFYFDGSNWIGF